MRRFATKTILLLSLVLFISAGCGTAKPSPAPTDKPAVTADTGSEPQSAAATAVDYAWRPSPDYRLLWREDPAAGAGLAAPNEGKGGWWVHESSLKLPGMQDATVRFVQWRGNSIMDHWGVYAQQVQKGSIVYTSPELGDELAWYRVVSPAATGGFALVVGTLNHGGQREWRAGTAVIPFANGFGNVQKLEYGYLGGSTVTEDQSKVLVWAGQFATMGEEGVIINCLLCIQHMTVTPYSWQGLQLVKGQSYRTRLMYPPGSIGAALEKPVDPKAQQAYADGLALVSAGNLADARQQFAHALALDETFSNAANELGYTFILKEDWAGALPPLATALKIDPEHPAARYNMALALYRLGRNQEALKHAAYAELLQPDRSEPKALLKELQSKR